jgi:hypothetical protein
VCKIKFIQKAKKKISGISIKRQVTYWFNTTYLFAHYTASFTEPTQYTNNKTQKKTIFIFNSITQCKRKFMSQKEKKKNHFSHLSLAQFIQEHSNGNFPDNDIRIMNLKRSV